MEPKLVGEKVKKLIEERNVTYQEFAKKLGISVRSLQKKLSGEEEFYVSEVIEIAEIFDLDIKTVSKIFFSSDK